MDPVSLPKAAEGERETGVPSPRQEKAPSGEGQSCQTHCLLSLPEADLSSHLCHQASRSCEHTPGSGGRVGLVINVLSRREAQSGPFSWSLVVCVSHQLHGNPGYSEMFLKEENYPESVSQRKVGSKKVCTCSKALSLSPPARLKACPVPPWDF